MAKTYLQACRSCRHEFQAGEHVVGRTIACPHCRRPLDVVAGVTRTDRLVGQRVGQWWLTGRLGAGAFGMVYRARTQDGSRHAAVKLISETAAKRGRILARFEREAELGRQAAHPNLVGTIEFGFERGAHWLATELVDGPNLATLIEEDGPLPWEQVLDVGIAMAKALGAIHAVGIVHRDLKPANILVGSDGVPRLADLGLAKQLEPDETDEGQGLTIAGMPLGTPAFMPPEQVRDAKSVGPQADIYSLGATLYYLLTAALPYDGGNSSTTFAQILTAEPAPLADLVEDAPPRVVRAVETLMARDPAQRPADAAAALALLEQVKAEPHAAAAPAVAAAGAAIRSVPWAAIGLIAGVVIVAALIAWGAIAAFG